jgi:hypothetical protein
MQMILKIGFGVWEFLNICVWILNLIFVFQIECDSQPVNVEDWLMVSSFVPLGFDLILIIILIVENCCLASGFHWPEEAPITKKMWAIELFLNSFQIIWALIGIKLLVELTSCDQEWLVIVNQVAHGLILIRAIIILKFALVK